MCAYIYTHYTHSNVRITQKRTFDRAWMKMGLYSKFLFVFNKKVQHSHDFFWTKMNLQWNLDVYRFYIFRKLINGLKPFNFIVDTNPITLYLYNANIQLKYKKMALAQSKKVRDSTLIFVTKFDRTYKFELEKSVCLYPFSM